MCISYYEAEQQTIELVGRASQLPPPSLAHNLAPPVRWRPGFAFVFRFRPPYKSYLPPSIFGDFCREIEGGRGGEGRRVGGHLSDARIIENTPSPRVREDPRR